MFHIKTYLLLLATALLTLSFDITKDGFATSTGGAKIHYRTFGTGKPLLIINGGPGMNSDGFEGVAKKLSENCLTIIYDQRGTGQSRLASLDATTITMDLMVEDIEALRKQLNIDKWSILGHSFGGMVVSYYATKYPEHIDKIVLSSSGGVDLSLLNEVQSSINSKLTKAESDSVDYWSAKIDGGDTSHFARLRRGINLAHAYVIDPKFIPVIGERLTQGNQLINQLMWADLQMINFNCVAKLRSYEKPVLIIQGNEDIVSKNIAEKSHQAFKNSKMVFMDHCIHYGWLDNPEVYFKEVNEFLK
jgi:proline iminopeptidase